MSAGKNRHPLYLLIPVEVDDGEGGQTIDWPADGPIIFGNVQPISAREQAIAGAVQTIASHRISTYYDRRIVTEARFLMVMPPGLTLQILGIRDVDGMQRWLDIDCAETV